MVGRQPHASAAFTPRGIPSTHFLEAELTPGHMVLSVSTRKIPVTDATGIRSRDRPTSNHCATPGPVVSSSTSTSSSSSNSSSSSIVVGVVIAVVAVALVIVIVVIV